MNIWLTFSLPGTAPHSVLCEPWRETEPTSHCRSPKGQLVAFPASLAATKQVQDGAQVAARLASKPAGAATVQTGVSMGSDSGGGSGGGSSILATPVL